MKKTRCSASDLHSNFPSIFLVNQKEQHFECEYSFLLDYLFANHLICKAQAAYILLAHAHSGDLITMLILHSGFVSYENCIKGIASFTKTLTFANSDFKCTLGKYSELNSFCKQGYVCYQDNNQNIGVLVKNLDIHLIIDLVSSNTWSKISICTSFEFFSSLEVKFGSYVLAQARSFVKFINFVSAADLKYGYIISGAFVLCGLSLRFCSWIFHLANVGILFSQNCFKIFLIWNAIIGGKDFINAETDYFACYPYYSVLVPAYREKSVKGIVEAISRFLYPKHKLDVKLLVEEDDHITERAIKSVAIPHYVHVLKVPRSHPKTKPKALNFAMPYVIGQYVTVYDVEDIPEPSQLLKSLEAFNRMPMNYMCMQAKLRFYNMHENLLTKMMSIEYGVLFNFLVYGLSITNFPVPLGGTSNHFKTEMLRQIGCWDAYNVAEDADLGVRIFANRYRVGVIESFTSEEAPVQVWPWLLQRSRWIKGYWQTLFVFFCHREKFNIKQAFGVYNFIGFATYNQLIFPIATFCMLFEQNKYVRLLWMVNTIASFTYVLLASILGIYKLGLADKKYKYLTLTICYMAYFCLHFVASIIAILDLAITPFRWHKTEHGVSKTMQRLSDISLRYIAKQ